VNHQLFKLAQPEDCQVPALKNELFARTYSYTATPTAVFQKAVMPSMTMRIELGSYFELGLQQRRGTQLPIEITSIVTPSFAYVQGPQRLLPTAMTAPRAIALFPDDALIPLEQHRFLAVHLGTQTIQVLATAASVPPVTLTVEVVPPAKLGTASNEHDYYLTMVAHNTGIVPQLVKGQVLQEGDDFNVDTFRYEPCGEDVQAVMGGLRRAFTDDYYQPFRLDDAIGFNIFPDERDQIDPRSKYSIMRINPATHRVEDRRVTNADRNVTARELWDDNDTKHVHENWTLYCGDRMAADINAPGSTMLDFVAQTVLASSYGLQQVMWHEAVRPDLWDGVTSTDAFGNTVHVKAPWYLFDRPEYINIGGGSVQLGLNKIARTWLTGFTIKHVKHTFATSFKAFGEYEAAAGGAFRTYNWYLRDKKTQEPYGVLVVKKSHQFWPAQATTVFPEY
jgi:hypothetical protein